MLICVCKASPQGRGMQCAGMYAVRMEQVGRQGPPWWQWPREGEGGEGGRAKGGRWEGSLRAPLPLCPPPFEGPRREGAVEHPSLVSGRAPSPPSSVECPTLPRAWPQQIGQKEGYGRRGNGVGWRWSTMEGWAPRGRVRGLVKGLLTSAWRSMGGSR